MTGIHLRTNGVIFKNDAKTEDFGLDTAPVSEAEARKIHVVWMNVLYISALHLAAIYGAYLLFTSAMWQTNAFTYLLNVMMAMGITAGAHRLWSHRSYKAKWPLRLILIIFNTLGGQTSAINWARDHRLHHKYSDTDADPHNSNRGFFFSHMGWLMCRKHNEVKLKGKDIDVSDLYADPLLRYQKKYYLRFVILIGGVIPTVIPVYFWNESWSNAAFVAVFFRYIFFLHATCLINSAAHMWGNKPYDKLINPSQNIVVTLCTMGEGYHNYHHAFPWDYKASELGFSRLNFATDFIDFFGKIGWAYDLKTVSEDVIRKRIQRTGDGSHPLWGWGDKDQPKEEIENAIVINRMTC